MMNKILLNTLRPVFEQGYRPARGTETYSAKLGKNRAYEMVNCLAHVLNLRNEQIQQCNLTPNRAFCEFPNLNFRNINFCADFMLQFFRDLGLSVQTCDPAKEIKDFKSWKCALYFGDDPEYFETDYHFLLEEAPGIWSSKIGFSPVLEHIYTKEPPKVYHSLISTDFNYDLFATYQLTNPKANPDNQYVQDRKKRLIITPEQKKFQHCVVQTGAGY